MPRRATPSLTVNPDTFPAVDIAGFPPPFDSVLGHGLGLRLKGVDCPELRGSCERERKLAAQAKEVTAGLLVGKAVTLENISKDKYFRLGADVIDENGQNVAGTLIEMGLGVPYDGGKKSHSWC